MDNRKKYIYEKVKVDKYTYKYRLSVELLQLVGEIIGMFFISRLLVPHYISWKLFIIIAVIIILLDIVEMLISTIRLKNNYICYEEKGKFLIFYIKDFYEKKSYIALSHIKYIIISQNMIQKKYDLSDIIICTGTTKHKFQSLNKIDADKIKNELGELMSENDYKD